MHVEFKDHCKNVLGIESGGLVVSDLPYPYGRGVVSTKKIGKGATLMTIPKTAFLTVNAINESENLKKFLGPIKEKLSEDDALAIIILYEKHVQRERSKWSKHIAVLPTEFDLPFSWTDEQINSLAGTGLCSVALRMKTQIKNDYEALAKVIDEIGGDFEFTRRKAFTYEEYVWAVSCVWSRCASLRIGKNKGTVKAMVPFFDMFNSDPASPVRYYVDPKSQSLHMVTDAPIEPGVQIFSNQGILTSRDCMKLYGYVNVENQYERVQLEMQFRAAAPDFEKKLELIKVAPPEGDQPHIAPQNQGQIIQLQSGDLFATFQLSKDVLNDAQFRFLRIITATSESLPRLEATLKRNPNQGVDIEGEATVMQLFAKTLVEMLGELGGPDAPSAEEKERLDALYSDVVLGKKKMAAFTKDVQAALGYDPIAEAAKTAVKRNKKGKKKIGRPTKQHVKEENEDEEDVLSDLEDLEDQNTQFSMATTDCNARRLQFAAHCRFVERLILESQLKLVEQDMSSLKKIIEDFNAQVTISGEESENTMS